MRLLGAILAGGASRRFGSDKAEALYQGRPLIAHVACALGAQCAATIVVGRDWNGLTRVDDLPGPGMGPLGGIAGALAHAVLHGFDAVLTSGCDLPDLPRDLVARLGAPDAVIADQPTVGLWHASHADALARFVAIDPRRSIRGWTAHVDARRVQTMTLANINRPEDLTALHGATAANEERVRRAGPRSWR